MNLYLVERTDNIDYDEHDATVVSAPRAIRAAWLAAALFNRHCWRKQTVDSVKVTLLATNSLIPQGYVLSSFNAG